MNELNFYWLRMHFRKCSQLRLIRGAFGNFIDSPGRHFSLFSQPSSLPTPPPLVFQWLLGWPLRSMYLWVALLLKKCLRCGPIQEAQP